MTKKTVDARNLSSAELVTLTIHALEEAHEVTTIVDNEKARENVAELARSKGCDVSVEQKQDGIYLTLTKAKVGPVEGASQSSIVLFIASDVLGRGDDRQLGSLLMQKFLHTVCGLESRPDTILLINIGVKLATEESPVLGELRQLENQGIDILACGTCLSRFQLTDKVAVGQVSDMYSIASALLKAGKVVSL